MDTWIVVLAWLMFLAIFPLGAGMLFRAWKIGVRHDPRYVADWRGRALLDARRWATPVLAINTVGGAGLLLVGILVVALALPFAVWTGATALILWSYFFALQTVSHRDKAGKPV